MHRENAKIISMRVKTQNSSLVPFVAAAEAGGFAVVVDIFLKLFEMKPVWKFASSCGGFIYTRVCILKLRNKNGRRCEETREKKRWFPRENFFSAAAGTAGEKIFPLEKKGHASTTNESKAPDKLLILWKEKEGRKCTQKHRALSSR